MNNTTNHPRSFTSSGAPRGLRLCGLLALSACAPSASSFTHEASAAQKAEADGGLLDPELLGDDVEAAASAATGQALPSEDAIVADLCGTNATLGALLGCSDSGVGVMLCASTGCDAGLDIGAVLELAPAADAVQAAANGAVAQVQDAGSAPLCQTDYLSCATANPTRKGLDTCDAEAAKCGFRTDVGPSIACATYFAPCFLADWSAYQRCLAEFRACVAELSND